MVKEKTGRAMQEKERERKGKNGKIIKVAGCSPIREGVLLIRPDTTLADVHKFGEECQRRWGITPLQIFLHKDEGHWLIIEKQKAELQRIEAVKRHKERQVNLAEQELRQVKSEIRTDKLKSAATDAATVIASGVGSLFGSGKMKKLEQSNEELRQEITKRDKGIDDLKAQMQRMQEQHGNQIRNLQGIHKQELEAKDKEISRLNTLLEKAFKWFPMLREMLRMEKLCAAIGFTKEMIESLLTKKEAIRCNGRIYFEEHRRKFDIKNDIFKVEKNPTDDSKLILTINKQSIDEWFKEQFGKLGHSFRKAPNEPRKGGGFRL